jgi:hypothetical protein
MKTIVVLPHGWVLVGDLEGKKLSNASTIRVWGTSKGLGELAKNGPTEKTILDSLGDVKIRGALFEIKAPGWK